MGGVTGATGAGAPVVRDAVAGAIDIADADLSRLHCPHCNAPLTADWHTHPEVEQYLRRAAWWACQTCGHLNRVTQTCDHQLTETAQPWDHVKMCCAYCGA